MAENQILVSRRSVVRALGATALLLVFAYAAVQVVAHLTGHDTMLGLVPLFDLDAERNIPTFFASFLLLLAASLLLLVALLGRRRRAPDVAHWAVLACGFACMAVDEYVSVHERLSDPMRRVLGQGPLGVLHYAWAVPAMALVALLAIVFMRFWLRLPGRTRLTVFVAATLYVGGAVGVELVGGRQVELHGNEDAVYHVLVAIEEGLEMAGVVVFISGLLGYLADTYQEVCLQCVDSSRPSRTRQSSIAGR